ncbi:succinate dehydrogenase [ubiquinone] cytochrome b small subunit: mitochondrial-like protein [Dinothrombium tinctorium]|uniref:Succinate dehydrogenase [ubiquinone] cytochrome b small subunit n=1 Tax=Dinothrombium tinctorium TaxID=1965070 RepID=A0A3S3Q6R5_9ACAR|nr:succinate dehydrogenase [ubiquinone] cytochrome b small subunit: mitochondrial-like protein [Dinothrombium tinctorium]RWS15070.1 succinate dehydrogenase [ubiquinone] cytochrome b small subunit: mitochondrial-like protein [Dinothrombium tinctorium]
MIGVIELNRRKVSGDIDYDPPTREELLNRIYIETKLNKNIEWFTNDPATIDATAFLFSPSSIHSGHSKLWTAERVLSAALIAVMPASFFVPLPAMDYLFALSVIVHIHWGMEAIVVDYIRPSVFGNVIPKVSLAALYLLSILALGGLFYFNYSDVGVTQAIRMMSKI